MREACQHALDSPSGFRRAARFFVALALLLWIVAVVVAPQLDLPDSTLTPPTSHLLMPLIVIGGAVLVYFVLHAVAVLARAVAPSHPPVLLEMVCIQLC